MSPCRADDMVAPPPVIGRHSRLASPHIKAAGLGRPAGIEIASPRLTAREEV
jgi:hypothetical protein